MCEHISLEKMVDFDGNPVEVDNVKSCKAAQDQKGVFYLRLYDAACDRCGGQGGWKGWPGYTCFECGGSGRSEGEATGYDPAELPKVKARIAKMHQEQQDRHDRNMKAAKEFEAEMLKHEVFALLADKIRAAGDEYNVYSPIGGMRQRLKDQVAGHAKDIVYEGITVTFATKKLTGLFDAIAKRLRDEAEAAKSAKWYGTPGEKIELKAEVVFTTRIESPYGGTTVLIKMAKGDCTFVMFTAAGFAFEVEQGDVLNIAATIKDHSTYHGAKQTVLTRPKLLNHQPTKGE